MFNGLKQFNGFVQLKTVFFMIFFDILTVIINEEKEEETKMNKLVFTILLLPVVRPIYGIILPKKINNNQ